MRKKVRKNEAGEIILPKSTLRSFFMAHDVLRNADVQEMMDIKDHVRAGQIARATEAAGLIRKMKTTKQANLYGPGKLD